MARLRETIREDARFRILCLLAKNPRLSQRELAEAVGISAGGVHYVLSALVQTGMVKIANFRSAEDKRRYAYLLTPEGMAKKAEITRQFLERKVEEFEALRDEIEALHEELHVETVGEGRRHMPSSSSPENRASAPVPAAAMRSSRSSMRE
jgi:EPS-associated MarR family transcriptional regulator